MDLTHTFDSVDHNKLIKVLLKFGIKNKDLNWFSSYLGNCKHYVELTYTNEENRNKYVSNQNLIKYCIPQGSVLGLLLFICYITGMRQIL